MPLGSFAPAPAPWPTKSCSSPSARPPRPSPIRSPASHVPEGTVLDDAARHRDTRSFDAEAPAVVLVEPTRPHEDDLAGKLAAHAERLRHHRRHRPSRDGLAVSHVLRRRGPSACSKAARRRGHLHGGRGRVRRVPRPPAPNAVEDARLGRPGSTPVKRDRAPSPSDEERRGPAQAADVVVAGGRGFAEEVRPASSRASCGRRSWAASAWSARVR